MQTEKAKKSAKTPPARKPRPVQTQIPGTEDVRDPKLTQLATEYRDARDHRMQLWATEIDARDVLLAYMRETKVEVYRDTEADMIVSIEHGRDKVKVRTLQQEHDEPEAGEGQRE